MFKNKYLCIFLSAKLDWVKAFEVTTAKSSMSHSGRFFVALARVDEYTLSVHCARKILMYIKELRCFFEYCDLSFEPTTTL